MTLVGFNSQKNVIKVDNAVIDDLKQKAKANPEGKYRLCLHKSIDDTLHEMIIVHSRDNYVRPHKHPAKTETFHVLEGRLAIVIFDETGQMRETFFVSEQENRLFRLDNNIWHTVLPLSNTVVFHEITNGPFTGTGDSVFPAWAPDAAQAEAASSYTASLLKAVAPITGEGAG